MRTVRTVITDICDQCGKRCEVDESALQATGFCFSRELDRETLVFHDKEIPLTGKTFCSVACVGAFLRAEAVRIEECLGVKTNSKPEGQ